MLLAICVQALDTAWLEEKLCHPPESAVHGRARDKVHVLLASTQIGLVYTGLTLAVLQLQVVAFVIFSSEAIMSSYKPLQKVTEGGAMCCRTSGCG